MRTKNEGVHWYCPHCGKHLTTYVQTIGAPHHKCERKADRTIPLTRKETK